MLVSLQNLVSVLGVTAADNASPGTRNCSYKVEVLQGEENH